jgi:hypothetical protein
MRISGITGDDLLTALYNANPRDTASSKKFFSAYTVEIIREAADLCGIDSTDMTRKQAIKAIEENF